MFVDTDYSLDMLRLVSILDRRLSAGMHARTHLVVHGPRQGLIQTLNICCST